jgi:hypothetical protein
VNDRASGNTERNCSDSGEGGLSRLARAESLVVGPLALGSLRDGRPAGSAAASAGGASPSIESVAVLDAGHTVRLAVPAGERRTVGLLYDKAKFRDDGLYRVREMDAAVRFLACKDRAHNHGVSQFDGGLVVSRPQCVTLEFFIDGAAKPVRRYIPIERPCPRSPARSG